MTSKHKGILNNLIQRDFRNLFWVSLKNPSNALFLLKMIKIQKKASQIRKYWETQHVNVPPFMIISITDHCNLQCKGCYAKILRVENKQEISLKKFRNILNEAHMLGISFIFIAGGEPLTRPELLDITACFPEIIFPVLTNGTLISDEIIARWKKQKNIIPVISIEGKEKETDDRRGSGIYSRFMESVQKLKKKHLFWGISFTITKDNFHYLSNGDFIRKLVRSGCYVFFFVEYVPVDESTVHLVLTERQKMQLQQFVDGYRKKYSRIFSAFPGDEEKFGGCLAAGRGFIHISSQGRLEPCPFAPYSDTNINNMPLQEALKSKLMAEIRSNHHMLTEHKGGCALWENREWVRSLLK